MRGEQPLHFTPQIGQRHRTEGQHRGVEVPQVKGLPVSLARLANGVAQCEQLCVLQLVRQCLRRHVAAAALGLAADLRLGHAGVGAQEPAQRRW